MTRLADPIVRHFRQILMWPLQLMPMASADQRNPGRIQTPWESLDQCEGSNPWLELVDDFNVDPEQFQERHYREFVTFLPHVQRFLYGQARSVVSKVGFGESPIRVFRRSDVSACRMHFPDGQSVDFSLSHVDLYFFFDIDIVFLVVEIFADDLPLSRVQDTLYRFGRDSPAGWNPDGSPVACIPHVEWLGTEGQVLVSSDMDDRAGYLAFAGEHRAQRIGAHWQYLLEPMVHHHTGRPGPIRYRQIEYHRMPKLSYLALDDPFVLTDDDFFRLAIATRPDDGLPLPYSPEVVRSVKADMLYDRFWNAELRDLRASTRVVGNGHAMSIVGSWQDPFFRDIEAGMRGQFRHQYFLVGLIAHFHKACLLMFSDRLINSVSLLDLDDPESERRFRDTIRSTREVFLRFNHRYWFHEVSNQSMARDLFEMWSRHLRTDRLFEEVREEVLDMGTYLDSDDARRQGDTVLRLTVVTIFGLIGTIATGFLGMNLIDEADNDMVVKMRIFASVLLPTVLIAILTVRYSKALSEILDTIAAESGEGWLSRLRRVRRVIAGRRSERRRIN
jgi:hypothetical protein